MAMLSFIRNRIPVRERRYSSPASVRFLVPAVLLLIGACIRIAWFFIGPDEVADGEVFDAAVSFARTGEIANPYGAETGATAHLLPLPIVFGGLVYRAFGIATPLSEGILTIWSVSLALASYAFFYSAFRRMGSPPTGCVAALAALTLVPMALGEEVITFRLWEGALAVAVASAYLLALVRIETASSPPSVSRMSIMALAAALVFFVSPQMGVAAYAASAYLMVRRLDLKRWPLAILLSLAALAALLGPWALRNQQAVGEPVLVRSNVGLEMAIGFDPEALTAADPEAQFRRRMETIHPRKSQEALERLRSVGGEVEYSRRLGSETKAWMVAHPTETLRLMVRHVANYLFPMHWYWSQARESVAPIPRTILAWLISFLALGGIVSRLSSSAPAFRYAAIIFAVTVLTFALVHPVQRYRYLILALSVYFAADFVRRLCRFWPPADRLLSRLDDRMAGCGEGEGRAAKGAGVGSAADASTGSPAVSRS